MRRRALFVTHEFPPRPGTGAGRLLSFATALRDDGWDVRVLSVRSLRPSRLAAARGHVDPPGIEVLRVPALGAPVYPLRAMGHRRLARWLDGLLPVDFAAPWASAALPVALASLLRRPADVIYASGPPFTGLVLGAACARATGAPLVLELRDPWVENPLADRPSDGGLLGALHARLDARLEAACWRAARRVVVTADALAEALRRRYPATPRPVEVVRNGWRGDVRAATGRPPAPPAGRPMRWLYPGTIIPGSRYTPEPLLDALAACVEAGRLPPDAVEVRLLTNHPEEFDRWRARHPRLAGRVAASPLVPRAQVLEAYAAADANLLCYPDYPGVPGKVYEFMAVGRPVLVVAPPGETRDLLERSGLAAVIEPDDPAGAASTLERVVRAFRAGEPTTRPDVAFIDGLQFEAQVARAVAVIGEAAGRAGGGG